MRMSSELTFRHFARVRRQRLRGALCICDRMRSFCTGRRLTSSNTIRKLRTTLCLCKDVGIPEVTASAIDDDDVDTTRPRCRWFVCGKTNID